MVSTVASFVETRFRKRRKSGNPAKGIDDDDDNCDGGYSGKQVGAVFFLLSEVIQTAAPVQGCCVLFLLLFSVALEVCDVQQIVLVLIFCQALFGKLGTTPPGSHGRDFSLSALRHKVFSSFPGNRSPSAKFSLLVLTFYNFFAIKFHFHLF